MSVNTIEKVKNIERQATEIEQDYEQQLLELKENTENKIAEMKKRVDSNLAKFKEKQTKQIDEKLASITEDYHEDEQKQIDHLELNFNKKKEQLVNKVVEEVMSKYGNS